MRLAQIAFACVCTTAFGRLVVPDVNMMPKGSIGSASRGANVFASPNRASKRSQASLAVRSSSLGASPLLLSVTAIQRRPGAAFASMPTKAGWVIAATARVCSAK